MAEEENNAGQGSVPPKQSPFTTVTSGASAAPKTIILRKPTLRRPGEAPTVSVPATPSLTGQPKAAPSISIPSAISVAAPSEAPAAKPLSTTASVPQGIQVPHSEVLKKITSRISVSSATSPIPVAAAGDASSAASPISAAAAKKMTTRIPLEAAMGGESSTSPVAPSAPKTIRLKRPSEVSAPSIAPATPATAGDSINDAPTMTGLPVSSDAPAPAAAPAAEDGDQEAPSKRKTIRVKRPGAGGGGAPKISLGGAASTAEGAGSGEAPVENLQNLSGFNLPSAEPEKGPDKVNPVFIVAASIAILAGILLSWTLSSQTYGTRGAAGDFAMPKGPIIPPPPGLTVVD